MVSIVWFLNGLFAAQPNNCIIFTSVFATFPLLPLLELSLLADTQAEGEKNGKSDVKNLSTAYVFIFVPGLPLYEFPGIRRATATSQPLSRASVP